MKKLLLSLLAVASVFTVKANPEEISVKWFDSSSNSFSAAGVASVDDILTVKDAVNSNDITMNNVKKYADVYWTQLVCGTATTKNKVSLSDYVTFEVTVKGGYKFTPTSATAYAIGEGTGNNAAKLVEGTLSSVPSATTAATNSSSAATATQMQVIPTNKTYKGGESFVVTLYVGAALTTKPNVDARDVIIEGTYEADEVAADDANLSGISVNGRNVNSFVEDTYDYKYGLEAGTSSAPVVEAVAKSDKATVEITQATSVNGTATIVVTAEDGVTQKTYTITFHIKDSEASFKTTGSGSADTETKDQDNEITCAVLPGTYIAGINGTVGLKLRSNKPTDHFTKGIQINVKPGYVVKSVVLSKSYVNTAGADLSITNVYVDGVAKDGWETKDLSTTTSSATMDVEISGIEAEESIEIEITTETNTQWRSSIVVSYNQVELPTYTKDLSRTGYASFSAPYNVTVPDGTTAYKAAIAGDAVVLTSVDGVIPANTGVILYNEARPAVVELVATLDAGADYEGNQLVATSEYPTVPATGTFYALSASEAKFVLLKNGITLSADKAYLPAPANPAGSLRVVIEGMEDGMQTSIETIETVNSNVMYDLQGRRANGKGLMIQNGKVVLVK